ncbi:MAG: hypothetical protein M0P73_07805 [Syntrophobacterales bacterium]|nr:hypothetical protein [Syntrophobacterales bacterium]
MKKKEWVACNYCIGFVDLLGQREEYKNEGLIPNFTSNQERELFNQKIKKTIVPIFALQKDAESMMETALTHNPEYKKIFPPELYESYVRMRKTNVKRQRWSDGLVFFTSLGDPDIKCPLTGIFGLFGLAGSLCFMGLARKQPIRGAIDIAWGLELHDGELYGAAVAKAYELESFVAQYPRIIVSERTINFLEAHRQNMNSDIYSQCNRQLADKCLHMLAEDVDGNFIIHYLGDVFRECISKNLHNDLYQKAIDFIQKQLEKHQRSKERVDANKLSFRYSHLLSYFAAHHLT